MNPRIRALMDANRALEKMLREIEHARLNGVPTIKLRLCQTEVELEPYFATKAIDFARGRISVELTRVGGGP